MHILALQTSPLGLAIVNSHRISIRIEVYDAIAGNLIYNSGTTTIAGGIMDGEVAIQNQAMRRRLSFQFTEPTGQLTTTIHSEFFPTLCP